MTTDTTAPTVTALELDAIRAIAENEFQDMDPTDPEIVDHAIWSTLADFAGRGQLTPWTWRRICRPGGGPPCATWLAGSGWARSCTINFTTRGWSNSR